MLSLFERERERERERETLTTSSLSFYYVILNWIDMCHVTRHNSADSVPPSNLVCITEVAIRTTLCIAGIIYYTSTLLLTLNLSVKKCLHQTFLSKLFW